MPVINCTSCKMLDMAARRASGHFCPILHRQEIDWATCMTISSLSARSRPDYYEPGPDYYEPGPIIPRRDSPSHIAPKS